MIPLMLDNLERQCFIFMIYCHQSNLMQKNYMRKKFHPNKIEL